MNKAVCATVVFMACCLLLLLAAGGALRQAMHRALPTSGGTVMDLAMR